LNPIQQQFGQVLTNGVIIDAEDSEWIHKVGKNFSLTKNQYFESMCSITQDEDILLNSAATRISD
jgi:hypothetical protein